MGQSNGNYRTLTDWRIDTDGLLATYITEFYQQGKSPATITQVVAAAKWLANNHGIEVVGEIASKTLAGIRREGKNRGKGQVDGVEREDMLKVVAFAESEKTIAKNKAVRISGSAFFRIFIGLISLLIREVMGFGDVQQSYM